MAVTLIIAFSAAAAESALASCQNRSETPSTTMTAMTIALGVSPVRTEMTANTLSKMTNGLTQA